MINLKLILTELVGSSNMLSTNILFIDFTGSHEKAQFLSQIIYWSGRTQMENGWFAKSHDEWHDEIRIKKDSIRRYSKDFEELGFLEMKFEKFAGRPCTHYRLKFDKFLDHLVAFCDSRVSQSATVDGSKLPLSTVANCHRLYTDINTDIKTDKKDIVQTGIFGQDQLEEMEIYTFDEFWEDYGKKQRKEKAEKEWKKLKPKEIQEIKSHIQRYVKSTPNLQYRLLPYRYLKEKAFKDEIYEQRKSGNSKNTESVLQEFASRANKYDQADH